MAAVSISEAARLAQISRPHLYNKYIKPGNISVNIGLNGKKTIDVSELVRVFGDLTTCKEDSKEPVSHLQHLTDEIAPVNKLLEIELKAMKELLRAKEEVIEAKDHEIQAITGQTRFLQDHIKELTQAVKLIEDKRPQASKGLWQWFKKA